MKKIGGLLALLAGLVLVSAGQVRQETYRQACMQRCATTEFVDPELQRQEIISLERESARAIQLNNGTFFRRIYSDDFAGTLSHGQMVNKAQWIALVESPGIQYISFHSSDIKVQLYEGMAVATCLWSWRSIVKDQRVGHQMRAIHVYHNGVGGWHVVSGQITSLPPDIQQPL